jgi:hypothetical protein
MDELPTARLTDDEVEGSLEDLDRLLGRIELMSGDEGAAAREAVYLLAEVYGEALCRAVTAIGSDDDAARRLAGDRLVGHLMALHGVHPDTVEQRVEAAVSEIGDTLGDRGALTVDRIEAGVATLSVPAAGCGAPRLPDAVREIVLGVAPELADVRAAPPGAAPPAFIPLESLQRRPDR